MNKFIEAIKQLDADGLETILEKDPSWINWAEENGKNALHFLGGVNPVKNDNKIASSLRIMKLLLKKGMNINSVHRIEDKNCNVFPATPLWYAYTKGRNEKLYSFLLKEGANPENCMYAIAWYDDVKAAKLFMKHGASIDKTTAGNSPFLAAFLWKRFEVAEWFLNNGANVNGKDEQGNTALYYAVKRKYKPKQINLLLHAGADPDRKNNEGISPRSLAQQNRQKKILSMFDKLSIKV